MNLVLIVAVFLGLMIYLKVRLIRHKIHLLFLFLLILFLIVSTLRVVGSDDVNFTSGEGISSAGKIYVSSFIGFIQNVQSITTYAVQRDWKGNSTDTGEE